MQTTDLAQRVDGSQALCELSTSSCFGIVFECEAYIDSQPGLAPQKRVEAIACALIDAKKLSERCSTLETLISGLPASSSRDGGCLGLVLPNERHAAADFISASNGAWIPDSFPAAMDRRWMRAGQQLPYAAVRASGKIAMADFDQAAAELARGAQLAIERRIRDLLGPESILASGSLVQRQTPDKNGSAALALTLLEKLALGEEASIGAASSKAPKTAL